MRLFTHGRLVGLAILAAVIAVRLADPGAVQLMRMRSFDVLQELFPLQPQDEPIAIVDIDDESLAKIGQWPWPRTIVAQMVDRLTVLGAVVIGFDIVFAEPDRSSPARAAESFAGLDDATRATLARLPSNDTVFAEALSRGHVVLGASVADRALGDTDDLAIKAPLVRIGGDPVPSLLSYPGIVRAIPELRNSAAGQGMFSIDFELDGIYRRVPLVLAIGHDLFPARHLRYAARRHRRERGGAHRAEWHRGCSGRPVQHPDRQSRPRLGTVLAPRSEALHFRQGPPRRQGRCRAGPRQVRLHRILVYRLQRHQGDAARPGAPGRRSARAASRDYPQRQLSPPAPTGPTAPRSF